MKISITLFIVFLFAITNGLAQEEKHKHHVRKLPNIITPKHIDITDPKHFRKTNNKPKNTNNNNKNQNQNNTKPSKNDSAEKPEDNEENIENEIEVITDASNVTGNSDSQKHYEFCSVFKKDGVNDYVKQYQTQIIKMNNVQEKQWQPLRFLCRAFSNLMLMEEGTDIKNSTYVENAKKDIKEAIKANKTVLSQNVINVIEDRFLTEIFAKYNAIVMKSLDEEQKKLVQNAIKQAQLTQLQNSLQQRRNILDESANIDSSPANNENTDLTPYYSKNLLSLLNSVKNAEGNTEEQTKTLRNFRIKKEDADKTETKLEDFLEVIEMFEE